MHFGGGVRWAAHDVGEGDARGESVSKQSRGFSWNCERTAGKLPLS